MIKAAISSASKTAAAIPAGPRRRRTTTTGIRCFEPKARENCQGDRPRFCPGFVAARGYMHVVDQKPRPGVALLQATIDRSSVKGAPQLGPPARKQSAQRRRSPSKKTKTPKTAYKVQVKDPAQVAPKITGKKNPSRRPCPQGRRSGAGGPPSRNQVAVLRFFYGRPI